MLKETMKAVILFFISLFYFLAPPLESQNKDRFIQLSVREGLSNGRVTSIVQDSLGFIWIGTKNGLNRYDSHSFKEYNQKNSDLSSGDISSLLVDRKGLIWIGTVGGGLNVYNPKNESFTVYRNNRQDSKSLSSDVIHTIFQDSEGTIFIGTEKGLNVFNEKTNTFKHFVNDPIDSKTMSNNSVWTISEGLQGELWVGTYGGGLNKFDKNTNDFARVHPKNQIKEGVLDFINATVQINERELLVGTNGHGLLLYNFLDNQIMEALDNPIHKETTIIRTIKKDNHGNLWVGTDGQGLLKISRTNSKKYIATSYRSDNRLPNTISNNTINVIFEDNQDNIWVGTAWKGINVLDKKANSVGIIYSDGKGYDAYPVLSVYKEGDDLWMGTDGKGLSILNLKNNQLINYNSKSDISLGGDYIQCIKKTKDKYWLGTFANGLMLFDKKKGTEKHFLRHTEKEVSLPYNDVRGIIEMPNGNLWIGTWGGGLSHLDVITEKFENFTVQTNNTNTISSNNITSMTLSRDNQLWIGTYGGGLNLFDVNKQNFTHYGFENEKANANGQNYIYCLLEDYLGNIWLGTRSGLFKFDVNSHKFTEFEVGISTNSNTVVSLIEDPNNNIWIGTKRGIFKYNPKDQTIEELENAQYEFHINAVFKDRETLYFGSVEGVIVFNFKVPEIDHSPQPMPLFTNFKLFDKEVQAKKGGVLEGAIALQHKITLNHDESVFTFQFSSFDYPISETQYLVKMEGFESEWRNIGSRNFATYTNLSSGDYTFKVKSKKHDNVKAEIQLEILPPFYKTWWAYLGYFLFFIMSLLAFRYNTYKWVEMKNNLKLEKLKREQEDQLHQLKQRFFTNVSHEIRTPLTLLIGTINSLMKSNVYTKEQKQLATLKSSTGRLMNLVSELLNIRKLETGNIKLHASENDLVGFVNEIFLAFSQHAIANDIHYKFEHSPASLKVWFDKIQLEKTIYNLLTNAFKFTAKGDTIKVSVFEDKQLAKIVVEDSGQGISNSKIPHIFERFYQNEDSITEDMGFGIGLSIVKDVVELHSGKVDVESKQGEGSKFTISLALGNTHFSKEQLLNKADDEELIVNYAKTSTSKEKEKEQFEGSRILIVEDNPHLLQYLESLLSENFKVTTSKNGKEGLDTALDMVPDIIISDVMMPVMDGITLCYELKSNIMTSHIPIILLTARTMVENIMEGFEMGADDYLVKPFNESILKVRINNLLNSRKQLREKYTNEVLLNPKEVAFTSPDQEFLAKLNKLIEDHIDISDFSVDQLASEMAMSHSNLYKKIKALTGMTTVAFIRDFRLKRAAQFLKQGHMSIIDVCFKVGYTDRRHFSQEFKKKFTVTPSAFVKEHKGGE